MKLDQMVPKSDPERQKMNYYIDWLKNQQVEVSKIAVRMYDQVSTTVVATKDIRIDEEILFIPDDLILNLQDTVEVPSNKWLNWNT